MNSTNKEKLAELAALTQIYLLQNNTAQGRLLTDPKTFEFFQADAKKRKSVPQNIIPQTTIQNDKVTQDLSSSTAVSRIIPPVPKLAPKHNRLPLPLPQPTQQSVKHDPNIDTSLISQSAIEESSTAKDEKKSNKKKTFFELDPPKLIDTPDLNDIKQAVLIHLPGQKVIDEILSDQSVKSTFANWKDSALASEVVILSFNDNSKQNAFLFNIALAIKHQLASATVVSALQIDQEQGWEQLLQSKKLRLIIAAGHAIQAIPGAMQYYREMPKQGKSFLSKAPLYLISDIALYFKEPQLKSSLWQVLRDILKEREPSE